MKTKDLFQKAGYDRRPFVILHGTNDSLMNNAAFPIAQCLSRASADAELAAALDRVVFVASRSVEKVWRSPVEQLHRLGFGDTIGSVTYMADGHGA